MTEGEEVAKLQAPLPSMPSSSEAPGIGLYVTVSFDDGPGTGLTALTSEDDACDERYWRFQEVHGFPPRFKVLFADGMTSFLKDLPNAEQGVLIDEDGDEHQYLKVEQLVVLDQQEREESKGMRRAPGGYGFIEVVEDASVSEKPEKKRSTTKKPQAAGISKRRKVEGPPVSEADAGATPSTSEGLVGSHWKSKLTNGVIMKEGPKKLRWSGPGAGPLVLRAGAEEAPAAGPNLVAEGEEAGGAGPAVENGSGGESVSAALAAAGVPREGATAGASARVIVEEAKTSRSVCRSCGMTVEKKSVRCGLQGYAGGRSVLLWAHASCFLKNLQVEYACTRRGRCKGSGEAFEVGQVRVAFEVGNHKSWWLPSEAARWTSLVVQLSGVALTSLLGIDELEEEHRGALLELLRSGAASSVQLKSSKAPKAKNKKPRATKPSKVPSRATADVDSGPAGQAEQALELEDKDDSDVELGILEPLPGCVPLDLDESDE
ncbi:unnamed protein product [Durusdinium trenchii]|uniref:PARP-type domain-containing protein n=1 Tax=Durusdinium trenchii TaxID=1381693 RepID=A0ABP0P2G6_9DINO